MPTVQRIAPSHECPLCPRLAEFRHVNRDKFPNWFNAPVPSFGGNSAFLLIVGLAPGLRGANRTGRPFTGDFAGDILYAALGKYGFAEGNYLADPQDGFRLINARVCNAVRCVPPENKPRPDEVATCRTFLAGELSGLGGLRVVLTLGRIAHESTVRALGMKLKDAPFAHGRVHAVSAAVQVVSSYHTSRLQRPNGYPEPSHV